MFGADGIARNVKLSGLDETFGGCAVNMCYTLAGLGAQAIPVARAGQLDFQRYHNRLLALDIPLDGIRVFDQAYCARAVIVTGPGGEQFTGFYPGPEEELASYRNRLTALFDATTSAGSTLLVGPDAVPLMGAALQCSKRADLTAWVPGQYAEFVPPDDLRAFGRRASLIIVNALELATLQHLDATFYQHSDLVVTNGAGAVRVLPAGGREFSVTVPAHPAPVDPTGCGDAFASGLVFELSRGNCLEDAVAFGIRCAADCLAHIGCQSHPVAR